jgi:hypothetical protein
MQRQTALWHGVPPGRSPTDPRVSVEPESTGYGLWAGWLKQPRPLGKPVETLT